MDELFEKVLKAARVSGSRVEVGVSYHDFAAGWVGRASWSPVQAIRSGLHKTPTSALLGLLGMLESQAKFVTEEPE